MCKKLRYIVSKLYMGKWFWNTKNKQIKLGVWKRIHEAHFILLNFSALSTPRSTLTQTLLFHRISPSPEKFLRTEFIIESKIISWCVLCPALSMFTGGMQGTTQGNEISIITKRKKRNERKSKERLSILLMCNATIHWRNGYWGY